MNLNDLKPMNNRVAVELILEDETTKGGIVIPNKQRQKTIYGKVHAVGPKVKDIKAGQIVVVNKWNQGKPFDFEGKEVILFDEGDILGVVEPNGTSDNNPD